jgi:histone H2A
MAQSHSAKAGLQFPVGRVHRLLKKGNYAQHVSADAPSMSPSFHFIPITYSLQILVYLATVLKYLVFEILELAGKAAYLDKRKHIVPCHLMIAIQNDDE